MTPIAESDYRRKIVSVEKLRRAIDEQRLTAAGLGKRFSVVQCHGCFDIVHPGHIRYLQFARTQGDALIVSITGDAAIDKGAQRPYIPEELRAENLAALEFVDYVLIDDQPTACRLLEQIQPDVYIKGHEYAASRDPRFLAEKNIVEAAGGRVIFSSGQVVFSSTRLALSLPQSDGLAHDRLWAVCHRHGIDAPSLEAILDRIADRRVLVLGDIVVERYILCDAGGVAHEAPMMSLRALDQQDHLGGAALVAQLASALGAQTTLITGLGRDRVSDEAAGRLKASGVRLQPIRHRHDLAVRTRYLVDQSKLFRVNRALVRPLDSVQQRESAELILDRAAHADLVIFLDSGLGLITPDLVSELVPRFGRASPLTHDATPSLWNAARSVACQGSPLVVGAAGDPHGDLACLREVDLLCCSERRLRRTLSDFGGSLSTAAYQLMQTTQARRMVVTLGKQGLVTFDRPSHDRASAAWSHRLLSEYLPSLADRVIDRLGCSESVLTASALALSCGAGLMQAAYLADALAALQIAMPSPDVVSPDRLRAWLSRRGELSPAPAPGPIPVLAPA